MKPIISLVAAMASNHVIGAKNRIPWHIPADLQHFKQLTLGKPVLMGRNTYESIGRPLPKRRNIVISRTLLSAPSGCELASSLDQALELVKNEQEVMVIGGQEVYRQALKMADRMYLTLINQPFEGDSFFPDWSAEEWSEIERECFTADADNPYDYCYVILERLS